MNNLIGLTHGIARKTEPLPAETPKWGFLEPFAASRGPGLGVSTPRSNHAATNFGFGATFTWNG